MDFGVPKRGGKRSIDLSRWALKEELMLQMSGLPAFLGFVFCILQFVFWAMKGVLSSNFGSSPRTENI